MFLIPSSISQRFQKNKVRQANTISHNKIGIGILVMTSLLFLTVYMSSKPKSPVAKPVPKSPVLPVAKPVPKSPVLKSPVLPVLKSPVLPVLPVPKPVAIPVAIPVAEPVAELVAKLTPPRSLEDPHWAMALDTPVLLDMDAKLFDDIELIKHKIREKAQEYEVQNMLYRKEYDAGIKHKGVIESIGRIKYRQICILEPMLHLSFSLKYKYRELALQNVKTNPLLETIRDSVDERIERLAMEKTSVLDDATIVLKILGKKELIELITYNEKVSSKTPPIPYIKGAWWSRPSVCIQKPSLIEKLTYNEVPSKMPIPYIKGAWWSRPSVCIQNLLTIRDDGS